MKEANFMNRNFFLVLLGTLCLAWPGDWVSAYQGGKVSNGGTIAGVVKFKETSAKRLTR